MMAGWSSSISQNRSCECNAFRNPLGSRFFLGALLCASAFADGMEYAPRRSYQRFYLPAERHVIEVVQPPYSGNFIINGARFTALTPACFAWVAGERIRLLAGDWNG